MLNIVIFGAPGSGKGTQSERIVEKYGINHISTGDVLRAEIKNGTELGKTAKGYIDQGQLIPDELMIDILASVFDSFKDSKGVIFDGFPRTIAQAEALKKMLAERGQDVSVMVDLDVPEEELMVRLIKRGKVMAFVIKSAFSGNKHTVLILHITEFRFGIPGYIRHIMFRSCFCQLITAK